jgi:hypothetical protein
MLKITDINKQGKSSRDGNILEFRKTHTLQETGDKFGITGERVRQIELLKNRKRCAVHDRWYYGECSHCIELKKYRAFVKTLSKDSFMKEVRREGWNRKRDFISTQHKIYLIKILIENYNISSVSEIARLFLRDRTTILHLYNKYVKKIL